MRIDNVPSSSRRRPLTNLPSEQLRLPPGEVQEEEKLAFDLGGCLENSHSQVPDPYLIAEVIAWSYDSYKKQLSLS